MLILVKINGSRLTQVKDTHLKIKYNGLAPQKPLLLKTGHPAYNITSNVDNFDNYTSTNDAPVLKWRTWGQLQKCFAICFERNTCRNRKILTRCITRILYLLASSHSLRNLAESLRTHSPSRIACAMTKPIPQMFFLTCFSIYF